MRRSCEHRDARFGGRKHDRDSPLQMTMHHHVMLPRLPTGTTPVRRRLYTISKTVFFSSVGFLDLALGRPRAFGPDRVIFSLGAFAGRLNSYTSTLYSSAGEFACTVTFLKVSDIRIPFHSRSFPSPGSPPPGSGTVPKRVLKLTTLYGTGQQEIGEFLIAGSECHIKQQRTYKFESTDSVSITKLHIYVDEVFNSGLTGHVTIDLKEFIGEEESEVHLEYPLSASHSRQRAAKLQIVVQCKGPPEDAHDGANDGCLDMDLETFLYDEFPESIRGGCLESPDKEPAIADILPPAGTVGENSRDTLGKCGALSKIPTLEDFEGEFLGLDAILKDFVAEYSQTRPFLVAGGIRKKPRERKYSSRSDLHAAVFFAAGVTMQQRLQSLDANSQSIMLRSQESLNQSNTPTGSSSRVLLRSQSDEFDVKRVLSSPDVPIPEVVTLRKQTTLSGCKVNEDPFADRCSPSPANSEIENVKGLIYEADGPGQSHEQSRKDFAACPTCSVASESRIKDTHPFLASVSPTVSDSSTAPAEETQTLIPGSSSKSTRMSALVVVRNILGVLFIAGVSFVLGMGAHGGFLSPAHETCKDGATNKWSEIEQIGAWKETAVISQMPKVADDRMGRLQPGRPPQQYITLSPPVVANKIDLPDQQWEGHRKIVALPHPADAEEVSEDDKADKVRELDWKRAYFKNRPAGKRRESQQNTPSKQMEIGPLSMLQQNARISQPAANGGFYSLHRSRKNIEVLKFTTA